MKVVALIDLYGIRKGKVYNLYDTKNDDNIKAIILDGGITQFFTLDFIFNNFSVLSFEEVNK